MPPKSLTLVLPAYNEAERIGPALDELFGYLRRRGETARDGAPGAASLPERIEVLVVDDGSTDGTAELVRARPEATGSRRPGARPPCSVRAARRQGRGGSGRDARGDDGSRHLHRRRHGDAARHDPAARRGARDATTSRSAAGSSRTGRTCARASRGIGGCSARRSTCSRRSGSSAPSRTPSAASRGSPATRPRTCSRASRSAASSSTSS